MHRRISAWLAVAALSSAAWAGTAAGQTCAETPERHAAPVVAGDRPGERQIELSGSQSFHAAIGPGWTFALEPQPFGWSIRLYDRKPISDAIDMSVVTPPYRMPTNARELSGWHFRNAANTGPNTGDVNAPQALRPFLFSRALAGTGGLKPSKDLAAPRFDPPDVNDGRGWLRILDYGLSDLEPGQKARMSYLKFEACLTWPKTDAEMQHERDQADPAFPPEDREVFGGCGLDLTRYALDAAILPRKLQADFDGDGSLDQAALIRRKKDGRRGVAVCLAGSSLHLAGLDRTGGDLRPGYIDRMEAWRVTTGDDGPFGYIDEPPWPQTAGDILVLERIEKETILLYWAGGRFRALQIHRYVEP